MVIGTSDTAVAAEPWGAMRLSERYRSGEGRLPARIDLRETYPFEGEVARSVH